METCRHVLQSNMPYIPLLLRPARQHPLPSRASGVVAPTKTNSRCALLYHSPLLQYHKSGSAPETYTDINVHAGVILVQCFFCLPRLSRYLDAGVSLPPFVDEVPWHLSSDDVQEQPSGILKDSTSTYSPVVSKFVSYQLSTNEIQLHRTVVLKPLLNSKLYCAGVQLRRTSPRIKYVPSGKWLTVPRDSA